MKNQAISWSILIYYKGSFEKMESGLIGIAGLSINNMADCLIS